VRIDRLCIRLQAPASWLALPQIHLTCVCIIPAICHQWWVLLLAALLKSAIHRACAGAMPVEVMTATIYNTTLMWVQAPADQLASCRAASWGWAF
jgi:hypothetical protein